MAGLVGQGGVACGHQSGMVEDATGTSSNGRARGGCARSGATARRDPTAGAAVPGGVAAARRYASASRAASTRDKYEHAWDGF